MKTDHCDLCGGFGEYTMNAILIVCERCNGKGIVTIEEED